MSFSSGVCCVLYPQVFPFGGYSLYRCCHFSYYQKNTIHSPKGHVQFFVIIAIATPLQTIEGKTLLKNFLVEKLPENAKKYFTNNQFAKLRLVLLEINIASK